jgi:hypothetical protein
MAESEYFIIPTIIAGFKSCRALLKTLETRNNREHDSSALDTVLEDGLKEIEQKWNQLAERHGKRFVEGDGKPPEILYI